MWALSAGRRLSCPAALWCLPPPAGRARKLLPRRIRGQVQHCIKCYSQEGEAPRSTGALRIRRRRALSPLERVSGIIPSEFISQEVRDLQDPEPSSSSQDYLRSPSSSQDHPGQIRPPPSSEDLLSPSSSSEDHLSTSSSSEDHLSPSSSSEDHLSPSSSSEDHLSPSSSSEDHLAQGKHPSFSKDHPVQLRSSSSHQESGLHGNPEQLLSSELHSPSKSSSSQDLVLLQGIPFQPGDLLIAEYKRRHYIMFKKMFALKNSGKLTSNWGAINNKDLLGKLPGEKIMTSTGHQLLVKRVSLDEYVLYMERGPTISYPKDITSMMMMMDVNPGDVILEAGSGSGALSLFLSRAVGPDGRVHSIEVRADHHRISKNNFLTWKTAWEIRSGRLWPDNVNFINKDIVDAVSDLKSVAFDAVALDMLAPQVALPAIIGNLKQGAICAVYIANITQVVDLLEGIRSCELPLLCEKIVEVNITEWLVAPSLRKDGRVSKRVDPQWNGSSDAQTQEQADDDERRTDDDDDDSVNRAQAFGQVPYIARPMPWQFGHTAFLVQLRKFKAAAEATKPEGSGRFHGQRRQ